MKRRLPLLLLGLLLPRTSFYAQDATEEKIRLLEQQIQELKTLKARQDIGRWKTEQCLKAVGREKFCTCLGENLPAAVSFEQYVHTMVTSKEELGYGAMAPEQKQVVDATIDVREKCIEKGFFK